MLCCHVVGENETSAARFFSSSVRQFLIYSTFVLVTSVPCAILNWQFSVSFHADVNLSHHNVSSMFTIPAVPSASACSSLGLCLNFISPKCSTAAVQRYRLIFSVSSKPRTANDFCRNRHSMHSVSSGEIIRNLAASQTTTRPNIYAQNVLYLKHNHQLQYTVYSKWHSFL